MLYIYQILVITSAYLTSHLLFRVLTVSTISIINHQNKENIESDIKILNIHYYECLPSIPLVISHFRYSYYFYYK